MLCRDITPLSPSNDFDKMLGVLRDGDQLGWLWLGIGAGRREAVEVPMCCVLMLGWELSLCILFSVWRQNFFLWEFAVKKKKENNA